MGGLDIAEYGDYLGFDNDDISIIVSVDVELDSANFECICSSVNSRSEDCVALCLLKQTPLQFRIGKGITNNYWTELPTPQYGFAG